MNETDLTVRVETGTRAYDIRIGNSLLEQAGPQICRWLQRPQDAALRILVVTDSTVQPLHADPVRRSLAAAGVEVSVATVPSGEVSKSFAQAQLLYDRLVDMAADRQTVVAAVGGGVVGDLAGFAAATYARGLRLVQIPTTLLAMVDSSVGGKTGINHPRGKNLIGAFHQPVGVLIDLDTLATLPEREYRSGLAEVVKYGVILDAEFFSYLENHVRELNARDPAVLRYVVARSCQLKADVVREDDFETTGRRAVLNYGHTFAHAFETLAGYGSLLHGEAVAAGMVCASRLAQKLGRISSEVTERQITLLSALGFSISVPSDICHRSSEIVRCMLLDKKSEGKSLRFVLPSRLGHVETVKGVTPELALECLS